VGKKNVIKKNGARKGEGKFYQQLIYIQHWLIMQKKIYP